jgi:uncharacterized small protein (DUF1192 family)
MADIVIRSKAKKVVIFEAKGMESLRIFPGFNTVTVDITKYLTGNPAAMAHFNSKMELIKGELNSVESEQAETAKARNDELNRLSAELKKKTVLTSDQEKQIEGLKAEIEELKAKPEKKKKKAD